MPKLIGVLDSGVGGLTVLENLRRRCKCNYVYVADHAYFPYGTKSGEEIAARVCKVTFFLRDLGVDAVVLACNTASAYASALKNIGDVYEIITPTCDYVTDALKARKAAVLATNATISSGVYQRRLTQKGVQTATYSCSDFVPFIENNLITSPSCRRIIREKLSSLPQSEVDAVILGCTHFPVIRSLIEPYCGNARIVTCRCGLPDIDHEQLPRVERYFTTGDAARAKAAALWYGNVDFHHVDLR